MTENPVLMYWGQLLTNKVEEGTSGGHMGDTAEGRETERHRHVSFKGWVFW
jgi:hypothetical protein